MRPIPNATDYTLLREAYFTAKQFSNDKHDIDLQSLFAEAPHGALVPFEVRQAKYGRGIFATQTILEGTPVWSTERYGKFNTQEEWNTFLSLLSPRLQTDVVTWAYVMEWDDGEHMVGLDLEPSSLINHGGTDVGDVDDEIVDCKPSNLRVQEGTEKDDDDEVLYVASHQIEAGDELLLDYSQFHVFGHSLGWFEDDWDTYVEDRIA